MELDQGRFQECDADGEIEKPFEVDALRNHIKNLVSKTGDQHISQFLEFPSSINHEFVAEEKQKAAEAATRYGGHFVVMLAISAHRRD